MKKTLLSIFVLSSIALSNSTIAAEYGLAPQQIEINGHVDSVNHCTISVLEPVMTLDNIRADQFDKTTGLATTEAKNISVRFSDCSSNINSAHVIIPEQENAYLMNIAPEENRSNIAIAIVNESNSRITDLSADTHRAQNINKNSNDATITIPVNYYHPNAANPVKSGQVATSVTLNINIDEDNAI